MVKERERKEYTMSCKWEVSPPPHTRLPGHSTEQFLDIVLHLRIPAAQVKVHEFLDELCLHELSVGLGSKGEGPQESNAMFSGRSATAKTVAFVGRGRGNDGGGREEWELYVWVWVCVIERKSANTRKNSNKKKLQKKRKYLIQIVKNL